MAGAINGMGDYYSQYESKNTSADKLTDKLGSTDYSKADADELMDACKEFEAYFVEQVVKAMEKMIPKDEEDSSGASKYLDYFSDTMTQEIASTVTEHNELGLAQTLYEQMKRNYGITEDKTSKE